LAKHAAHILTTAKNRVKPGDRVAIASTPAAVDDWAMQIVSRSVLLAAMMDCTPGYFNLEGKIDKIQPEDFLKMARGGIWGTGLESFLELVEAWRAEGALKGIELQT
jgi:hypothetical protein